MNNNLSITREQSDDVFNSLSLSLTQARQLYRYLRDTGKEEEATKAKRRVKRLEVEIDELLNESFKNWSCSVDITFPKLDKMRDDVQTTINKVKDDVDIVKNIVKALKILDQIIKVATKIVP